MVDNAAKASVLVLGCGAALLAGLAELKVCGSPMP